MKIFFEKHYVLDTFLYCVYYCFVCACVKLIDEVGRLIVSCQYTCVMHGKYLDTLSHCLLAYPYTHKHKTHGHTNTTAPPNHGFTSRGAHDRFNSSRRPPSSRWRPEPPRRPSCICPPTRADRKLWQRPAC